MQAAESTGRRAGPRGKGRTSAQLVLRLEAQVKVLAARGVDRGHGQHAQVGRVPRELLRDVGERRGDCLPGAWQSSCIRGVSQQRVSPATGPATSTPGSMGRRALRSCQWRGDREEVAHLRAHRAAVLGQQQRLALEDSSRGAHAHGDRAQLHVGRVRIGQLARHRRRKWRSRRASLQLLRRRWRRLGCHGCRCRGRLARALALAARQLPATTRQQPSGVFGGELQALHRLASHIPSRGGIQSGHAGCQPGTARN